MRQWPASVEGQTPVPLGDIQKYSKEVQIDLTVAHQDLEVRFPGIGRADHLSILHCPDDSEVWLKIDSPQAHPIRVRGQGAGISGFDSAPFERVFITNDPYAGGSVPPALIMQAGGDTGFKLTPVHSGDRVRVVDTVGIRRTDLHHVTATDDVGVVPMDKDGAPLFDAANPGIVSVSNAGDISIGTVQQGAPGQDPWPVQLNGSIVDTEDNVLRVKQYGTIMELYGATIDERPPANSVPVGATYMAVNTQDVWQSNGTDWVVM